MLNINSFVVEKNYHKQKYFGHLQFSSKELAIKTLKYIEYFKFLNKIISVFCKISAFIHFHYWFFGFGQLDLLQLPGSRLPTPCKTDSEIPLLNRSGNEEGMSTSPKFRYVRKRHRTCATHKFACTCTWTCMILKMITNLTLNLKL